MNLLKAPFTRFANSVAFRVGRTQPLTRRPSDSFNLNDIRWLMAAVDTTRFIDRNMAHVKQVETDLDLLNLALHQRLPGHVLEFGVASGRTLRHIGQVVGDTVHGFDSFEGLPEDWISEFPKGTFSQPAPQVGNAKLWVGWFDSTVPSFTESEFARDGQPVSVIHVDCDLYSSTCTVLNGVASLMRPGTRIVFDEYFNYPGWRYHEHKAFQEFCVTHQVRFEYLGYVPSHQQVAIEILAIDPQVPRAGRQMESEMREQSL